MNLEAFLEEELKGYPHMEADRIKHILIRWTRMLRIKIACECTDEYQSNLLALALIDNSLGTVEKRYQPCCTPSHAAKKLPK